MLAPGTATTGESFLWHKPIDRLQVGVAYLWRQGAFRGLANYELIPETEKSPNLRIGFGLQGIGTGNPGYFATTEKTVVLPEGIASVYAGVGFRTKEDHGHLLGGLKFTPMNSPWTLGMQHDGHDAHLFGTYRVGDRWSVGAYWIGLKKPGFMVTWSQK